MKTRLQVFQRWAAYRLGLRPGNGLKSFRLFMDRNGAVLWGHDEKLFPTLLASTRLSPGHWFGAIAPEFYEGDPCRGMALEQECESWIRHMNVIGETGGKASPTFPL